MTRSFRRQPATQEGEASQPVVERPPTSRSAISFRLLLRSKHFPACVSIQPGQHCSQEGRLRAPHPDSAARSSVPEDTGNGAGCSEGGQPCRDWLQKEAAGEVSQRTGLGPRGGVGVSQPSLIKGPVYPAGSTQDQGPLQSCNANSEGWALLSTASCRLDVKGSLPVPDPWGKEGCFQLRC